MMIPEDATSVAKYMYRIKSIVGGDYYFVKWDLVSYFLYTMSFTDNSYVCQVMKNFQ